jgi:hypothetical protein
MVVVLVVSSALLGALTSILVLAVLYPIHDAIIA